MLMRITQFESAMLWRRSSLIWGRVRELVVILSVPFQQLLKVQHCAVANIKRESEIPLFVPVIRDITILASASFGSMVLEELRLHRKT